MKKKVSVFMIGLSLMMTVVATFIPQDAKAGNWGSFDGNDCTGDVGNCWKGPTNGDLMY